MSLSRLLPFPAVPSDAELVARARDEDRWAREALYRRHASYLLGMVTRMLGRRDDAEEVVQDAFVAAFAQLANLREPEALRGWLSQIAVNLVRRRLRKLKLLRLLGLDRGADDGILSELAAPALSSELRGELALIDRALAQLDSGLRIAWSLRHVEGMELAEVAQVCGCSLATVKRRLAAAEKAVQAHVGSSDASGPLSSRKGEDA